MDLGRMARDASMVRRRSRSNRCRQAHGEFMVPKR
jgi:hypothetical protein